MSPLSRFSRHIFASAVAVLLLTSPALAAKYSVEALREKAPAKLLAKEIFQELASEGIRVKRGTRVLCDIWFRKVVAVGKKSTKEEDTWK